MQAEQALSGEAGRSAQQLASQGGPGATAAGAGHRRRVLIAWEHGRNLGHAVRLSCLGKAAIARGCDVTWALPRAGLERSATWALAGRRCEAPSVQVSWPAARRAHSMAGTLLSLGLGDLPAARGGLSAWLALFERMQPDIVLCDYAPMASMAACIARLPAMHLTNGFDAPPSSFPLFDSDLRGPYVAQANARDVARLAQTVESLARAFGQPGLRVADWLAWPRQMIDVHPALDLHGPRERAFYVGPFVPDAIQADASWPEPTGKCTARRTVFAYLRGRERPARWLDSLARQDLNILCVWPDAPTDQIGRWQHSGQVHLRTTPVSLPHVLPSVDAVVSYGSSSLLSSALLAGKAQLILPTDVEKLCFARRLEQLGVAIVVPTGQPPGPAQVRALLEDRAIAESARAMAGAMAAGDWARQRAEAIDVLTGVTRRKDEFIP